MNDKDKLAELFREFPGIGPRQAKRMVYFLLSADKTMINDLSKLISVIQSNILICSRCYRYFDKKNSGSPSKEGTICSICNDPKRDQKTLMIVARDVDLEAVERSGVYKGNYFVLGGVIPFLSKNPDEAVRIKELRAILPFRLAQGLKEIIFALNANPEGENTTSLVEQSIRKFLNEQSNEQKENTDVSVGISKLGRGFSTGTEVEYSDKETLKNAISSRS